MNEHSFAAGEDDNELDTWLIRQHHELLGALDELLDLDAGLREIHIPDEHRGYVDSLTNIVDIDAGLAAVLATPQNWNAKPSNDAVLGLGRELTILSTAERLSLRAACSEAVTHAMIAAHRVVDEFHAFLRYARFHNDHIVDDPAREQMVSVVPKANLAIVLYTITESLDDHVFDLLRDMVEATRVHRSHELDLAVAWTANVLDVYWISGREILAAIRELQTYLRTAPLDDDWDAELPHDCLHLHALLTDYASDLLYLERVINDFTYADLTDIDLAAIPLHGLRWSNRTTWPDDMYDEIRRNSFDIGQGLYEVHHRYTPRNGTNIVRSPKHPCNKQRATEIWL